MGTGQLMESRSNEGQNTELQGHPRGCGGRNSRTSVAWRRVRDGHWRRTGEWLDDLNVVEVSSSQRPLAVPEPMANSVSPVWRPWDEKRSENTEDLCQTISELHVSVLGSHKEEVSRSIHFVNPVPHTSHEVYPSLDIRTKKSNFEGKIGEKNLDVF